jgi:hypothetical protein
MSRGKNVELHQVFGISQQVKEHTYVDRGGLDAQLQYSLAADRHILIHGASKQGKSWLRSRVLASDSAVLAQCQETTSTTSLLTDALGALGVRAELRRTDGSDMEGRLDFRATGTVGTHILAKVGMEGAAGRTKRTRRETESQLIGQAPGNLRWVAEVLKASGKRIVIEDCHYLTDDNLRDLAFLLKALDGYDLHVVIIGIWPRSNPLIYYNGDLVGRIDDLNLTWSRSDLDTVLERGNSALNIGMTPSLRDALVTDSGGNVGLLQQLAEALCLQEKIRQRPADLRYLTKGASLDRARRDVAETMRQRFQAFYDIFSGSGTRTALNSQASQTIIRQIMLSSDEDLIQGINYGTLKNRGAFQQGNTPAPARFTALLEKVASAQKTRGIQPPIFTYDRQSGRLYLADQSLLFYRRQGIDNWQW